MRTLFLWIVALPLTLLFVSGQTTNKAATGKKATTPVVTGVKPPVSSANRKAGAKPAPAGPNRATQGQNSLRSAAVRRGARPQTARPVRRQVQLQPTADRYREIQQALAGKGYFQGMQDGVWGADSIDALKRFQKDQNLDGDGKLGALSLIGLGLGPKRAQPETMRPAADSSGIQPNLPAPQQP